MDWLGNRINEIHKLNELISSGFISLDAEIMDHKPQPNVWSINECFDHIIQSNNKYYSIIDSGSLSTYKKNIWNYFPLLTRLLGKLIIKSVSPNYKGKTKTFPNFYPTSSVYNRNLTNELLDENKLLIAKIKPLKEEVLDRIIVKSPVNGLIAYSLRDCLTILVEHEKRHYNQAIKLKQQIESSSK